MILYEGILEQFIPIIGSILTSAVLAGMAALVKYLVSRTRNEKLREALSVVGEIAGETVEALMQSEAEALKEAAADGKLSPEDRERLKATAIRTVLEIAPGKTLEYLRRVQVDMDKYLDTAVEAGVRKAKNGR